MATTTHAIGKGSQMKFFDKRAALGLLVLGVGAARSPPPPAPSPPRRRFRSATRAASRSSPAPDYKRAHVRDQRRCRPKPDDGRRNHRARLRRGDGTITKVDAAAMPASSTARACSDHQEQPGQCIRQRHGADADPGHHGEQLSGQTYGAGVYSASGDILISGAAPLTLTVAATRTRSSSSSRSGQNLAYRRHVERDLHRTAPSPATSSGRSIRPFCRTPASRLSGRLPWKDHATRRHRRRGQAPGSQRQRDVDQRHDHAALDVRHAG